MFNGRSLAYGPLRGQPFVSCGFLLPWLWLIGPGTNFLTRKQPANKLPGLELTKPGPIRFSPFKNLFSSHHTMKIFKHVEKWKELYIKYKPTTRWYNKHFTLFSPIPIHLAILLSIHEPTNTSSFVLYVKVNCTHHCSQRYGCIETCQLLESTGVGRGRLGDGGDWVWVMGSW